MIESPFSSLSAEAARALADASVLRQVAVGAVVFAEGDRGSSLLLVSSGLVAVQVGKSDGGRVTVAMRGPGEMFGETALFARSDRRSATVVARTASRFLELDHVAFASLRDSHREVDDLFLRILAERSAALTWQMAEAKDLDAFVLLARRLVTLPGVANGVAHFAVTMGDLGGLSGLTENQVAEQLLAMQGRGWVRVNDGVELEIVDSSALAAAASIR